MMQVAYDFEMKGGRYQNLQHDDRLDKHCMHVLQMSGYLAPEMGEMALVNSVMSEIFWNVLILLKKNTYFRRTFEIYCFVRERFMGGVERLVIQRASHVETRNEGPARYATRFMLQDIKTSAIA